ncbi:MAG: YeeE/YedE family protein [Nevskia sp.]|nr:YeeE/YedE family protein [Nevskia sp.]
MPAQYLHSLLGGLLIGSAAALLLLGRGQIAGISGVVGNLVERQTGVGGWRIVFLLGLIAAPLVVRLAGGEIAGVLSLSWPLIVVAGLLVGFGTRLGSGCTSGHGVCGLGNLSQRSLVATITFMAVAALTVFVTHHLLARG